MCLSTASTSTSAFSFLPLRAPALVSFSDGLRCGSKSNKPFPLWAACWPWCFVPVTETLNTGHDNPNQVTAHNSEKTMSWGRGRGCQAWPSESGQCPAAHAAFLRDGKTVTIQEPFFGVLCSDPTLVVLIDPFIHYIVKDYHELLEALPPIPPRSFCSVEELNFWDLCMLG